MPIFTVTIEIGKNREPSFWASQMWLHEVNIAERQRPRPVAGY